MACAISVVKYLMFIFNFIFAVCGLGQLVEGILLITEVVTLDDFLDGGSYAPPILLIVVGSLVFIVAFFGCCGAIRENYCMLITYMVSMIVIIITQIVVVGLAFAFRADTNNVIQDKLREYIYNYDEHKDTVNELQTRLKCCGYEGYLEYLTHLKGIPNSCCESDTWCTILSNDLFKKGCKYAFDDFINVLGLIIGILAVVVAVIEIVGIIFALCLINSIKNAERRGR